MKILVLGLRGFPNIQGGIEKHAEALYPRLAKQGCDVEVIGRSRYAPEASSDEWRGVRFRWLWAPNRSGLEALGHSLLGVVYAASKRPDILHIHAVGPGLVVPVARLFGLNVVVTHHGQDYERQKWGRVAKLILRLGERMAMQFAAERIVISEGLRRLVDEKYGLDSRLIPNGVDASPIVTTANAVERFGLIRGKYILQVSRLVPEKRQLDLIAAFRRADLEGWKLVLVGGTEFRDEYSERVQGIAARDPRIVCTGVQLGMDLQELYAHSGIFVLPSSHEGLPLVLLEALSHGLRTIASDIPANREVGMSTDSYFKVGDIEALARLLTTHAARPLSQEARNRQRDFVHQKYNWDAIAAETLSVYCSAVGGTQAHRADDLP